MENNNYKKFSDFTLQDLLIGFWKYYDYYIVNRRLDMICIKEPF